MHFPFSLILFSRLPTFYFFTFSVLHSSPALLQCWSSNVASPWEEVKKRNKVQGSDLHQCTIGRPPLRTRRTFDLTAAPGSCNSISPLRHSTTQPELAFFVPPLPPALQKSFGKNERKQTDDPQRNVNIQIPSLGRPFRRPWCVASGHARTRHDPSKNGSNES